MAERRVVGRAFVPRIERMLTRMLTPRGDTDDMCAKAEIAAINDATELE